MKTTDDYLLQPELKVSLHGIELPLEYLFRGMLVVGQPGSGKTRCLLMPLIREILRATGNQADSKCGLLVADPKNELAPFLVEAAKAVGREEDVIVLKPGTAWYNPLSSPFLTPTETVEKIISWASNTNRHSSQRSRGDEMFWANAQRSLLTALVATARAIHGELDFKSLHETMDGLNGYKNMSEANKWLRNYPVPEAARRGLADYLSLPTNETRPCVQASVTNTLYYWQHQPLAQLVTPAASLPAIDPLDVIDQGKILVIGCSGAAFGASITPFLLALKEHFFTALLSRDQIDIQRGDDWKPLNQTRPFFIIADEFQSYLSCDPAAGELGALDRLRGFKASYIAATQNLASLHSVLADPMHATRLISLFSNQAFLANICPVTARQAEHILGQRKIWDHHVSSMAPPWLFQTKRFRPRKQEGFIRKEPRVTAATLAAMKTGKFWVRLANGQVSRKAARPFPSVHAVA